MDGVEVMREIGKVKDEIGNKLDKTNKAISDLVTEIRVYNQSNDDAHSNFDKRLCEVEDEIKDKRGFKSSNSLFKNFVGPTRQDILIKIILILVTILSTYIGVDVVGII